jgi:hypothetical protein
MKVTNVTDHITHAVIGSGTVESFGISEDAELYHILSSALYSRKKEAAAREILCNAWDSHVESGIERPLEVTLTNDIFMVRDFGEGIAPNLIKPIYGTYGSSTKLKNALLTGGFGLGTKAPFAYTDHFEVISYHAGTKNVYRMSKSNAEVGGKPSINNLVSVPTTEQGLSVSFNILSSSDREEFEKLVESIAKMGGMKIKLNGTLLETFPFDEATNGFMLIRDEGQKFSPDGERLRVRYGHVAYPLPDHPEYQDLKNELAQFLVDNVSKAAPSEYYHRSHNWLLVMQAPAHGITVTPSRESLSLTDTTVATLTKMLRQVRSVIQGKYTKTVERMFAELFTVIPMVGAPMDALNPLTVPLRDIIPPSEDHLCSLDDLARHNLKREFPTHEGFRKYAMGLRFDMLEKLNPSMRGLIQQARKFNPGKRTKGFRGHRFNTYTSFDHNDNWWRWFNRYYFQRLFRGDTKAIKREKLSLYGKYRGKRGNSLFGVVPLSQRATFKLENPLNWLRGYVILTHNTTEENLSRLRAFPITKWLGPVDEALIYRVPRNPKTIAKAREHFEKHGLHVLDLTKAQSWEEPEAPAPVVRAKAVKAPPGLPALSNGVNGGMFYTEDVFVDGGTRLTNPTMVVQISKNAAGRRDFEDFSESVSRIIATKWGAKIGVVQNARQADVYLRKGAVNVNDWIKLKLKEEYTKNPGVAEHYKNAIGHRQEFRLDYDQRELLAAIVNDKDLRTHFNLADPTPKDVRDIVMVWEKYSNYDITKSPELTEIQKLIKSWAPAKPIKDLAEKLTDNLLIDCLDVSGIRSALANVSARYTAAQSKAVRTLVQTAIEG